MKVVSTPNAPAAIGPYSQALDLGNMVFVSGQIPVDPATGKMADTVEEQAAQSLANLKAILAEAGLTMSNVVKTVIFLADINDFEVNDLSALPLDVSDMVVLFANLLDNATEACEKLESEKTIHVSAVLRQSFFFPSGTHPLR